MSLDPSDLLRRLEPAVRRGGPGPAVRPVPGIATADFGDLLTLVASGRLQSDRPVVLGPAADIDPPPTPDQLTRIASAADEAERAGARRAVMLIDGRGMVLDVPARRLETEARAGGPAVTGLDAAVAVPDAETVVEPPGDTAEASGDGETSGATRRGEPPGPATTLHGRLGPPAARPADIARAVGSPSR